MARETFNPILVIKELADEYQMRCSQRGQTFELLDFPADTVIRGDAHYLKRAYDRLLENAVKFTPEGGTVQISGRVVEQAEVSCLANSLNIFGDAFFAAPLSEKYLEVAIIDSGIGISKEDQLQIFDKFHGVGDISSHSSSRASFGSKGVGLGLTLVKGVIETHEGLVWVESGGPNEGSRFNTLLPLCHPDEGKHVLG